MLNKSQPITPIDTQAIPVSTKTKTTSMVPTSPTTSFTLAEVARHSTQNDCWIIINNNVYNATDYLFAHPGGASAITPYCGADATAAYKGMTKHGGRAAADLATLLIGSLK